MIPRHSRHDKIARSIKMLGDKLEAAASNTENRELNCKSGVTSTQQRLELCSQVAIDFESLRGINSSHLCVFDDKFHIEAVNELLGSDDAKLGFVVMDEYSTLFGTLSGSGTREVLQKLSVDPPKRHGINGLSVVRYACQRAEKRRKCMRDTADVATQLFINPATRQANISGLLLCGSSFGIEYVRSVVYDPRLVAKIADVMEVSCGGEIGFNVAIELHLKSYEKCKCRFTVQFTMAETDKYTEVWKFQELIKSIEATSTQQRLELCSQVPPKENDKVAIDFESFRGINSSHLCVFDDKFHIETVNELLGSDDAKLGFVVMDEYSTLFGTLSGSGGTREVLQKLSVDSPKRHGINGLSVLRYACQRAEKHRKCMRDTADVATRLFINPATRQANISGLLLCGSSFGIEYVGSVVFDPRLVAKIVDVMEVSSGGEIGFNEAIELHLRSYEKCK